MREGTTRAPRVRLLVLLLGSALVAVACGGDGSGAGPDQGPPESPQGGELVAQVASYDLAVGHPQRVIVGLLTADQRFVSGGTVDMRFSFLGGGGGGTPVETTAEFLAVPGDEPEHEHPEAGSAAEGRGVYAARDVEFDLAGPWQVEVTAEVEGKTGTATAAFQVLEEHLVPAVGEPALRTRNLTVDDVGDAPAAAVDSRAESGGEIPDEALHDSTIAAGVKAGRPMVVVFATPVYCVSQFCGPITSMIADMEEEHGDAADFIHVEVWRDFQNKVINKAAADWLLHEGNLQEPWVFFIDGEGRIRGRWDNVATRGEIEPFLEDL